MRVEKSSADNAKGNVFFCPRLQRLFAYKKDSWAPLRFSPGFDSGRTFGAQERVARPSYLGFSEHNLFSCRPCCILLRVSGADRTTRRPLINLMNLQFL